MRLLAGYRQDLLKLRVRLKRAHCTGVVEQGHRKGTQTGPNLNNHVGRLNLCKLNDFLDNVILHQEVLTQPVFGGKAKTFQRFFSGVLIS